MRINSISMANFKVNSTKQDYRSPRLSVLKADTVSFGSTSQQAKQVVILLGAPNSGKGTVARKIAEKFAIPQISTGDILRNELKKGSKLGLEAKKYMDNGGLVPDDLIIRIFQQRIAEKDCARGFILDGFPRTINQAEKLDELLSKDKNVSLKIINLDVDKKILYQRSANRYVCADCSKTHAISEGYNPETSKCDCGGKLVKRADDTPEVLTKRLENYEEQTMPLVGYYGDAVANIDVHGKESPLDKILERVNKVLAD